MVRHETAVGTLALAMVAFAFGPVKPQETAIKTFIDFRSATVEGWYAVNDGVMGGRSSADIRLTDEGTAVFAGNLSLENNGGFASVRTEVPAGTLAGFSHLVIRVRGDGKRFEARLRTSTAFDGIAYRAGFETIANEWVVVELPLASFEPSFRGYRPADAPALDPAEVRQVGLMLTDKQEGPFRLEISWIGVNRLEEPR